MDLDKKKIGWTNLLCFDTSSHNPYSNLARDTWKAKLIWSIPHLQALDVFLAIFGIQLLDMGDELLNI